MKHIIYCMGLLAICVTPTYAQDATHAPSSDQQGGLNEIVVTAQRREESLQHVPVAVTAFNADELGSARVANVRNLSGYAPNFQVTTQGLQSTPTINIRGISSGTANNAVDPKVGLYLDGVYVGRTVGAVFDLADIERVEVLRGPQGTLFGRNATAGAVSLITAPPTGEFGVKQSLSYGNDNALRIRTVLNLPSLGPLSFKLAYLHDEIDGDTKNLLAGRSIDLSRRSSSFGTLRFGDKFGGRNTDAAQFAARFSPDDGLTFDYRFDYTDLRSVGRASQLLGTLPGTAGTIHSGILGFQPITGGITNLSVRRLNAVANASSTERVEVQGHSLTATWAISDDVKLKSITAFRKMQQHPYIYDMAATGGIRFSAAQLGMLLSGNLAGIPQAPVGLNDSLFSLLTARKSKQRQFSQELQLQVTNNDYDLVMGGFYFHERAPETGIAGVFQPVTNGMVIPGQLDARFGSGTTRSTTINASLAAYGQLTYHVTDTFDLTGGLRYTIDHRRTNLYEVSGLQGGVLKPGSYKSKYKKLNYTVIGTWRPTAGIMAYGKVSTGYVSGGIMNAIPYGPESLLAFEGGLKTQLFNNRFRANIAIFHMKYKDLQTSNFVNGVVSFNNAGKANISGFEAEIDAMPTKGLTLSGSLGYSDFNYKKFVLNGVDVAATARPAYFSKWTARASMQYEAPEFANGSRPFAKIDARWRSSSKLVATPIANPIMEERATTKPYWLIDGRVGLSKIPLAGMDVSISAYGQNLLNKEYYSFGAPVTGLAAIYDRGRTYGIELSTTF
ncbi:TonB-dependent receptor [Caenibius sp. WL]|uniref:TonB-dependent receptor n=1 Tax=Caenibius sp. WL TaxID=2872646 RepID=UPI001C998463|nr:TonB-dependent receptor [Caenibius sp. WL]